MSSYTKQAVPAALKALAVLLVVLLFFLAARAQISDSGGAVGGSGLDGSAASDPEGISTIDSDNGPVNNTIRRGCADASDPEAANSGLPPCTSSDDSAASGDSAAPGQAAEPAQTQSTLSGGAPVMRGVGQGISNTISSQSMPTVVQQLGISPHELGSLKNKKPSGGPSSDGMQELCLHFAAKQ